MKFTNLALAATSALALVATSAQAATTYAWAPQSTDTGSSSDFDLATQTFAPIYADTLSFAGFGFYHNHGNGGQLTIDAIVNGVNRRILTASVTEYALQSFGDISFAGGLVSGLSLGSTQYVGNAYHSFSGETFTLSALGAGGVPEPSAWALLILGFGLTGAAMRSRKATVSYA